MNYFSNDSDRNENIGELVFDILLGSNIYSISYLYLDGNGSWYKNHTTKEERSGSVDGLAEFISKQTNLIHIYLSWNHFSNNAT